MKYQSDQKSLFDAEMNEMDFQEGELNHLKIEKQRRLIMLSSLTKTGEQIKEALEKNEETYIDSLELGLEVLEHYQDLVDLLKLSIGRIYIVFSEHADIDQLQPDTKQKLLSLLKASDEDLKH